jgi:DNA-binding PadR family transcriptional regulator
MTKTPAFSNKEEFILNLLRDHKEFYALQIVKLSNGFLKNGTVYHVLYELEEDGYVEARLEPRNPTAIGPPRRLYEISALGVQVLEAWQKYQLALEGILT